MPAALSLVLWVLALVCFIASWMTGDRRQAAAGTTCLVLYIISVARRRTGPPVPRPRG